MPQKPKTTQPETPNKVQGRDLFQTPNYATKLLLPFIPKNTEIIWECACGKYKIVNVLLDAGYEVIYTDLDYGNNFLTGNARLHSNDAIITNPPFSLKQKFYKKCKSYNVPFALLIPAEYCQWLIDAIRFDGAEKIIPTRRIDYITPYQKENSSSQFHSMWLTWGFELGRTETFVELTNEMKKDI